MAAVVELHHDWVAGPLDEAAVLFLADKLVRGDQEVTIAERFGASAAKCMTVQAKEAHARRRAAAEALERRLMKGKNGRL